MAHLVSFSGPDSATDLQRNLGQGTTAPSGAVSSSVSRCGDIYLLGGANRSKDTKNFAHHGAWGSFVKAMPGSAGAL